MLEKPASIASSHFKSAKWDEITSGRDFRQSDAPTIALLCQWYEVVDKCMQDIATVDGIEVAYINDMGDEKARPQLSTMKQASGEIRQLNKQLGINDEAAPSKEANGQSVIDAIVARATERRTRAAG